MPSAFFPLERALLEALAYSDIFEHPLTLDELHRYLPVRADKADLLPALNNLEEQVESNGEYYFLAGRMDIVETRKERVARSKKFLPHALRYGRILGALPFVRMVALTGSLAVMNVSKNADFDYMLVAEKGRVWTARAFALVLNRIARLFGHTLCPNLIVSETSLEWPLHDLYSARELCQMVPIVGMEVYRRVIEVNSWARVFLPNSFNANSTNWTNDAKNKHSRNSLLRGIRVKNLLEVPLYGKLGDRLERWERTRKIARFSKLPGIGEETVFNAEVCQGNFHHHRKWTHEVFQERLSSLEKEVTVTFKVTVT
jgi:hypothetical protein